MIGSAVTYSEDEKRRALSDLGWEVRQAAETAAEFLGALMSGQQEMPHGILRAALLHQRILMLFLGGSRNKKNDVQPADFVQWETLRSDPDMKLIRKANLRISRRWMHLTWHGVLSPEPFRIVGDLRAALRVLQQFENELMRVDPELGGVIQAARQEADARLDALDRAEYELPN